MKITFLGATRTVTGSKYLLETPTKKILIDCGLYQGRKDLRLRNWQDFPVNPKDISAVILTHAHIDHTGYLPLLIKQGFRGPVYCSSATRDLCAILLPDSGHLQEEEAYFANKRGSSKHKPAKPLYTREDAVAALNSFHVLDPGKDYELSDNLNVKLCRSGHIIGATFVIIKFDHKKLMFSGDLGRPHDYLMKDPSIEQQVDYLVLESTYGDRLHSKVNPMDQLEKVINKTVKRGGTVVIPSFAVGRAQLLIYMIHELKIKKRIPPIPIYLDSPMADKATKAFCHHIQSHRLTRKEALDDVCNAAHVVTSVEESKQLDSYPMPKVIISASGMATGGRVLHHLKVFLPHDKNTVLLAGFQAPGTRGDLLASGHKEVKIFGDYVSVKADIESLQNASAHADYEEIIQWLSRFEKMPQKIFLTHGELNSAKHLKIKIKERLGVDCIIPEYLQSENL